MRSTTHALFRVFQLKDPAQLYTMHSHCIAFYVILEDEQKTGGICQNGLAPSFLKGIGSFRALYAVTRE
jgi:hypothetical protein